MSENKGFSIILHKAKPYLFGVLKGSLVFFIFYLALAFFMLKTNTQSPLLYYLILLFIILGGFACGVDVYKRVRGRGFLTGIISSVPYSLVVFFVIIAINGFDFSAKSLVILLLSVIGGFLGGITAANTKI